jgi:hypothetical protein
MVAPRHISKRTGIRTATDENVMAGDVAGMRRTQERAGRAELVGAAEPP